MRPELMRRQSGSPVCWPDRAALQAFVGLALLFSTGLQVQAQPVQLEKGDHICLVGNALCERMQHSNQWEALLYERFPELDLVVRNLKCQS